MEKFENKLKLDLSLEKYLVNEKQRKFLFKIEEKILSFMNESEQNSLKIQIKNKKYEESLKKLIERYNLNIASNSNSEYIIEKQENSIIPLLILNEYFDKECRSISNKNKKIDSE